MAKIRIGRFGEYIVTPVGSAIKQYGKTKGDFKCQKCKDTGWILCWGTADETYGLKEDGTAREVEFCQRCPYCDGSHEQNVKNVMKRSNIPIMFKDAKYSQFNWDYYITKTNKDDVYKMKKMIDSFILDYKEKWEDLGKGFYIWSRKKGTGKTFLASCICNELMRKNEMVTKFAPVSELLSLEQNRNKESLDEYERDPIKILCNCKILVLDDLGQKNTGNEWLSDILFRIIDARMQKKLSTIVTANMPIKEIRFDDRISDRLNRTMQQIPLPDCQIRSKEAYKENYELLKDLGIIGEKEKENEKNNTN